MNNSHKLIFCLILLCFFLSCGGGSTRPVIQRDPETAKELAQQGWVKYEAGNFSRAVSLFKEARKADESYLDSYNGLGWSYFRLHDLLSSLFNFRIPINADSSFIDVQVGYAISSFEKNEYAETIRAVLKVTWLDSTGFDIKGTDEYFFEHDVDVTSREVRQILALSYYYTGEFDKAFKQLLYYLNPLTKVDPDSEDYLLNLLNELK